MVLWPCAWATGRKVWQGTVTPSRRRTPGSIPGSPTTLFSFKFFCMFDGKSSGSPERVLYMRHTSVCHCSSCTGSAPIYTGFTIQYPPRDTALRHWHQQPARCGLQSQNLNTPYGLGLAPIKQFARCAITLQFKIAQNNISNRHGHRICRCLFQVQTRQNPHAAKAFILRTGFVA